MELTTDQYQAAIKALFLIILALLMSVGILVLTIRRNTNELNGEIQHWKECAISRQIELDSIKHGNVPEVVSDSCLSNGGEKTEIILGRYGNPMHLHDVNDDSETMFGHLELDVGLTEPPQGFAEWQASIAESERMETLK